MAILTGKLNNFLPFWRGGRGEAKSEGNQHGPENKNL